MQWIIRERIIQLLIFQQSAIHSTRCAWHTCATKHPRITLVIRGQ